MAAPLNLNPDTLKRYIALIQRDPEKGAQVVFLANKIKEVGEVGIILSADLTPALQGKTSTDIAFLCERLTTCLSMDDRITASFIQALPDLFCEHVKQTVQAAGAPPSVLAPAPHAVSSFSQAPPSYSSGLGPQGASFSAMPPAYRTGPAYVSGPAPQQAAAAFSQAPPAYRTGPAYVSGPALPQDASFSQAPPAYRSGSAPQAASFSGVPPADVRGPAPQAAPVARIPRLEFRRGMVGRDIFALLTSDLYNPVLTSVIKALGEDKKIDGRNKKGLYEASECFKNGQGKKARDILKAWLIDSHDQIEVGLTAFVALWNQFAREHGDALYAQDYRAPQRPVSLEPPPPSHQLPVFDLTQPPTAEDLCFRVIKDPQNNEGLFSVISTLTGARARFTKDDYKGFDGVLESFLDGDINKAKEKFTMALQRKSKDVILAFAWSWNRYVQARRSGEFVPRPLHEARPPALIPEPITDSPSEIYDKLSQHAYNDVIFFAMMGIENDRSISAGDQLSGVFDARNQFLEGKLEKGRTSLQLGITTNPTLCRAFAKYWNEYVEILRPRR